MLTQGSGLVEASRKPPDDSEVQGHPSSGHCESYIRTYLYIDVRPELPTQSLASISW